MNLQSQLAEIIESLQYVRVESTLIIGAIVLLVAGMINKSNWLIKSVYSATICLALFFNVQRVELGELLSSSLYISFFSQTFTALFLLSGLIILVYKRSQTHSTEFYFLVLSLLAGSVFMMKANSFLVAYLSIELASFSGYILTNFLFKKESHEAGIKYLLFGAVASATMLLGFAMLYGATGIFYLSRLNIEFGNQLVAGLGLTLVVFGLFFKASIVPFHIWVPGTYQSAPNDATAIFSIVPKLGALVLLHQIFIHVHITEGDGIMYLCLVLGILTILFGTLSALRQTNVRRMISFGAIAHSGFLLPLAILNSTTANEVFWWYTVVYAFMNLGIFFFLDEFEQRGFFQQSDYAGLGIKIPLVGVCITIVMVSLIGLPPFAGFTAKLFLFTTLWEQYIVSQGMIFMTYLVIAVLATLISLFFYLRVPYHMFLVKQETTKPIDFTISTKIIATLFSIVLLLLFFAPQILAEMQQLLTSNIAP